MAWIKLQQSIANHPKTFEFSELLDMPIYAAVGVLSLLWLWALNVAPDGDLSKFKPTYIARAVQWDGDAEKLFSALKTSGFLDGDSSIHNWEKYGGKLLENKAKDAERKRQWRKEAEKDVQQTSTGCPEDVHRMSSVDKIRIDKTRKENIPPIVPHGGTEPEEFLEFWSRYPRKEGRKNALKAWKKLSPSPALVEEIMSGLKWRLTCEEWTKDGGKYIPLPATWLNGERWTDARPEKNNSPNSETEGAESFYIIAPEAAEKYAAEQRAIKAAWRRARENLGYDPDDDSFKGRDVQEEHCRIMEEWRRWYDEQHSEPA